jgi:hypothetical protein
VIFRSSETYFDAGGCGAQMLESDYFACMFTSFHHPLKTYRLDDQSLNSSSFQFSPGYLSFLVSLMFCSHAWHSVTWYSYAWHRALGFPLLTIHMFGLSALLIHFPALLVYYTRSLPSCSPPICSNRQCH